MLTPIASAARSAGTGLRRILGGKVARSSDRMPKDDASLSTTERIELGKTKMGSIVDNAIHLIELYEANDIIIFPTCC